ncbi:TPR-like protein [Karstenula rhodostoma CBS 690.94]|uniref:TPR-like protein n=1 Tax=Karstenula rhodostoma CBS 690.94 TaxID=1392251 RepID=A0A9P4PYM3_9PLEO|nr:TPR-like protein [Karstenula rhodostoma CBS 690.94]
MAEAVAVVGAVAAFSQLAKYGAGLAKYILDCPSEVQSIPATVEDLIEHLNWHRSVVKSFIPKEHNHAAAPSVQHLISRSLRITLSLQQLLTPLLSNEGDSGVKKLRRVFSYQKRIRKITKYRAELESCERRLILHFSAASYRNAQNDVEHTKSTSATLRRTAMITGISVGLPPRSELIGRDSTLRLVSRTLVAPGNKACLVGLGGIGKSETAKECIYRIHDLHPEITIIWIHACDPFAVQTTYDRILRGTRVWDSLDSQNLTMHDLLGRLDTAIDGQWALIVDDITSRTNGDIVLRQLASTPIENGSVLFTTGNMHDATILANGSFIFSLGTLMVGEATELLRLHLKTGVQPDEGINPLLQHLEYHPLAIAKAAGIMRVYNLSATRYVELLGRQEDYVSDLLRRGNTDSPGTVDLLGTDMLSIVPMKSFYERDEDAGQLLAIMACLGNARIPLTLFDGSYRLTDLIRSLSVLRESFLISTSDNDDTITIPRLVRLSVRTFLRQHRISSTFALRTLQLISQSFPETEKQYSMLRECGLLLPHALAILHQYAPQWTDAEQYQSRRTASLYRDHTWGAPSRDDNLRSNWMNLFHTGATSSEEPSPWDFIAPLALRVSHFLRILGQYGSSFQLAWQALQWLSDVDHLRPSPVETFLCESNIASLSHYLGHPTIFACRVEQLFRSQTVLLKSHRPLTIRALRSKALALQAQGRHGQAEGYHRRAIAICSSIYGPKDVKLLDENHGLALSVLGQGRANEALRTFCEVYNAMEGTLGLSNPKTLSVLANIGCALQHLSRWTEAYEVMSRALSGRKRILGEDHPHTIQSRANLAQIYVTSGDMAGAEMIIRETLRIHVVKLGEDHHLSLHILNNLGYLLLGQDRYAEAAETLYRVASKRDRVLGPQHCDTLASMFYASEAYWKMGRFDEALSLGRKVLEGRRNLDEGEPSMKEIESRLAEVERDRWLVLVGCQT